MRVCTVSVCTVGRYNFAQPVKMCWRPNTVGQYRATVHIGISNARILLPQHGMRAFTYVYGWEQVWGGLKMIQEARCRPHALRKEAAGKAGRQGRQAGKKAGKKAGKGRQAGKEAGKGRQRQAKTPRKIMARSLTRCPTAIYCSYVSLLVISSWSPFHARLRPKRDRR